MKLTSYQYILMATAIALYNIKINQGWTKDLGRWVLVKSTTTFYIILVVFLKIKAKIF